ncbi:MAG: hypothetical protein MMC33_003457 [Icmadophila ericetorum]|nr:hypothetical protein [Icmadophila ericetorum]
MASKYAKLQNARVLIFGGTSGVGFCVAEASLSQGAQVVISGSSPSKLEHALKRLHEAFPDAASRISGYTCDLSDSEALESRLTTLLKTAASESPIDHIVFCAGDAPLSVPISKATVADMLKPANIRFLGFLMLAKVAPAYMAPGPTSSMTTTSGTIAQRPGQNLAVTCGWANATEGIARGLAVDLAPIRVNLVSLGAIHTELLDRFIPKDMMEEKLKEYGDSTLVGKLGRPEEVAEAYIYLMRDSYVTGTKVTTDGGRLLK